MQKRTNPETIRRIQETGYLSEIDSYQSRNTPKLTLWHDPGNSVAFCRRGGAGFIFYLSIATDQQIRLMEFGDLEVAGQRFDVDWWDQEDRFDIYRFDGRKGPEFHKNSVLNHRVRDLGLLRPGNPMEGWLLGRSFTPLPPSCCDGSDLTAILSIVDGYGTVHAGDLSLRFDPTLNIELARVRSSLYGRDEHRPDYSDRENEPATGDQIQALRMPGHQADDHNRILAADDSEANRPGADT